MKINIVEHWKSYSEFPFKIYVNSKKIIVYVSLCFPFLEYFICFLLVVSILVR